MCRGDKAGVTEGNDEDVDDRLVAAVFPPEGKTARH